MAVVDTIVKWPPDFLPKPVEPLLEGILLPWLAYISGQFGFFKGQLFGWSEPTHKNSKTRGGFFFLAYSKVSYPGSHKGFCFSQFWLFISPSLWFLGQWFALRPWFSNRFKKIWSLVLLVRKEWRLLTSLYTRPETRSWWILFWATIFVVINACSHVWKILEGRDHLVSCYSLTLSQLLVNSWLYLTVANDLPFPGTVLSWRQLSYPRPYLISRGILHHNDCSLQQCKMQPLALTGTILDHYSSWALNGIGQGLCCTYNISKLFSPLNHAFFVPSEMLFPITRPIKFPAPKSPPQSLVLRNSTCHRGTMATWVGERWVWSGVILHLRLSFSKFILDFSSLLYDKGKTLERITKLENVH